MDTVVYAGKSELSRHTRKIVRAAQETRPDESSHIWGVRVRQLESQKQPAHQG